MKLEYLISYSLFLVKDYSLAFKFVTQPRNMGLQLFYKVVVFCFHPPNNNRCPYKGCISVEYQSSATTLFLSHIWKWACNWPPNTCQPTVSSLRFSLGWKFSFCFFARENEPQWPLTLPWFIRSLVVAEGCRLVSIYFLVLVFIEPKLWLFFLF